jgi:ribonuclease HI
MKTIDIYTDGSYISSADRGGFGIIIHNGKSITSYGGHEMNTTSNRMELTAVISALLLMKKDYGSIKARVFSDSKYVINAAKLGWLETWAQSGWQRAKGRELKNKDLWQEFYPLYLFHSVEFYWVASHNGHPAHEKAHKIAYGEAKGESYV